ncbi:hypothetical protein DL764_007335 [Monosporascus ibericus]|uniref:RNA helicase n=1 Tax=Monosporascus ibericus TaxID=155417 RepID=A0A4Q4T3Z0_9PEZI|nr:hypothetical protein DL764_007335 [Monosporascus ibericus]
MPKFVPRQRKHKVLARQKAQQNGGQEEVARSALADSNAVEIIPEAQKAAREARKAQLREELKGDGKLSGKKAKRLEKYIDIKLKKDETRALLSKLAENKIDTTLFQSTRSLGQGKETKRQALSRALREREAGVSQDGDDILFEPRRSSHSDASDDEPIAQLPGPPKDQTPQDGKGEGGGGILYNSSTAQPTTQSSVQLAVVGSGLKRPLELDDEGRPVIQKRQKRGGVKSKISVGVASVPKEQLPKKTGDESEDEWNGFSSDAPAHDSASSADEPSDDESEEDSESESPAESSSEDDASSDDEDSDAGGKQRSSAFKAWAHEQRNQALGYKPTENGSMLLNIPKPANFKPRAPEVEPLPQELLPTRETGRKAFSVSVDRPPVIQEARLRLPVVADEQRIMEAIYNNNVVVICGATGSGKTTQVPQFLFEAGYGSPDSPTPGMIGVTQPRKVAAVSMSKRVGQELGDRSTAVAYQIRFEGTANENTAIKFMTDGVLLREVANDISLCKYSAVIIDEAHERSVNTDILIGMLSRVVKLREEMAQDDPKISPLKLIIMSATLRVDDLTRNPTLFPTPPPVLEIEGRQHPVTIHFSRQTRHDYVEEAFTKISRGHRKLPPGGFLVFLTGHDEISRLSKKLKMAAGGLNPAPCPKVRISANDAPLEVEDIDFGAVNDNANDDVDGVPFVDEEDEEEEDDGEFDISEEVATGPLKMHILPLYSLLPTKEQMRVFDDPPEDSRQIILATNVAETSLTIPGIRYVFDCGRSKERRYNRDTGVQSYEIGWISKASANQRAGRAGRTGPGHSQTEHGFRTNEDVAAETRQAQARQKYNEVHRNFRSLDDGSDAMKLLQVVGEFAHEPTEEWCEKHFVRFKALQETQKLRRQITNLLQKDIPAFANLAFQEKLDRPSSKQVTALKQMVAAGFIDQVAIRADLAPVPPEMHRKPRRAIDVPYVPLQPIHGAGGGDGIEDKTVYIHPSSVLAHFSAQECPEYIVYAGLQRPAADPTATKKPKTRMLALTDVKGAQLAGLAKGTPLLTYGKPIKEVQTDRPNVRDCWVVPYLRAEGTGGQGWPLPVTKVRQRKEPGKGWVVE